MEPTKPNVQLHLKDQSVFEGKKVRLDCVIIGVPEPEVIWYHDDQPVKESPDFQLVFQGDRCSLIIQEALLEDAGHYKVVALNSMGEASSQCTLIVQAVDKSGEHPTRKSASSEALIEAEKKTEGMPRFSQLLTDLLVVAGDTVQFECTVTGQPMPTVSWSLNNKELVQSERVHMSQDMEGHCLLKVSNVTNEDKGVYTARAANQQGEVKCFSHLTVKTPLTLESIKPQAEEATCAPYFTELFADTSVPEGGATKFECIVSGKPTPKVKWFFNDQPVSGKDFLVSTSGSRQVLSMPSVSKSLVGKVSCTAENEAGKATCVANLTLSEPSLQTFLPRIEDINLDTGVFEMKRAVFVQSESSSHFSSSTTHGGHEPVVKVQSTISKSEVASHKIGDKPAVQVESHKTSQYKNIDGVESTEESEVFKSSGTESSPSDNLKKSSSGLVIAKRKNTAPRFISPLNGCIVDQGADVTLTAIIEGYPTPEITWARNGGPVPQESETTYEFGKAVLKLKDVKTQHGGRYTCNAVNEAGSATASADVVVKKSQFPPVLGRRLQARTATVGERVALEIEVTGTPTPTVTWNKDGQLIRPTSTAFRIISQGNCHILIIDKVDHIHTGQYGAVAVNSAGEARSTADLLVVDPHPETGQPNLIFTNVGASGDLSVQPQTVSTMNMPPGGGMVVSESVKSEKHISMKVHKTDMSMDEVKDLKKNFAKTETFQNSKESFPKQTENYQKFPELMDIPKPTFDASKFDLQKSSLEKIETSLHPFTLPDSSFENKKFEQSSFESFQTQTCGTKQYDPPTSFASVKPPFEVKPFKPEVPKTEDLVTDSISTKSSLEFFKSIIKENEENKNKIYEPKPVKQEYTSSFAAVNSSYLNQWKDKVNEPEFILEPGPPPEMGYIPETFATKVKEDMVDKAKKLEESQKDLTKGEIPSGGVRIFPTKPQSPVIVVERKTEKQEKFHDNVSLSFVEPPTPVLRPSADIQVRPTSPRPSAEGVSMEKLWASKKEELKFSSPNECKPVSPSFLCDRPRSPMPSTDGLAMDKLWGSKHQESSVTSAWPPPGVQSETVSTSVKEESHHSSQFTSFQTQTVSKQPSPPREVPLVMGPKIIYVAEAHTTHKANLNTFSNRSEFYDSSTSQVVTEKTITPSEAKKLWQQPSVEPAKPKTEFKPVKQFTPQLDDLHIEPGPPPEIGFATPPPNERRQSYVEQIEQELEKDLEKPPSRHLVGAVRCMPPPKRESSVESTKSSHYEKTESFSKRIEKRSSSFCDESTFKPFPVLEPFPFKPETVKQSPTKFSTVPRPSKFQKKATESDYESDLEGSKIKARWTPWDSDTEEPYYRKVKPPSFEHTRRSQSAQPEPPPPSAFSQPPLTFDSKTTCSSKQTKHMEIQQFGMQKMHKLETSSQQITAKPCSPPVKAKPETPKLQRHQVQDSGYMADTDEPNKFVRQKPSMFRTEKVESAKKQLPTTQVHKETQFVTKQVVMPKLEPFPFKPSAPSPAPQVTVPLVSPSKFVKGDFKESDYESDYDTRIPPIWGQGSERAFRPVKPYLSPAPSTTPKGREPTPPSQFDKPPSFEGPPRPKFEPIEKPKAAAMDKKIHRPQPHYYDLKPGSPPKMDFAPPVTAVETSNTMSFAESTASSQRVVSMQQTTRVISFDQKKATRQTSVPVKVVPKGEIKYVSDNESESKSIDLKAEEKRLQRVEEMRKRFGERSQSLIEIKPGEPPQFDYAPPRVPAVAASVANKHINEMTSTFKTKAQQFVSDVVTEVKQNGKSETSNLLLKEKDDPQVYREETRTSEKGTKCIDPDTGLIYFKYDFGYEFGVILPGEGGMKGVSGGKPVKSLTPGKRPSEREDGSIEVKVIHEKSATSQQQQKKHGFKTIKWDPTSESEMSDAEDAKKKAFMHHGPRITIPATPSPLSMSPSISPYYTPTAHESQGATHWTSAMSPTPLSAPVVVNAMLHSEAPKKPPMFITPLRDIAVISGQTARFECIVQAEPAPNIIWAKDGRLIEPSLTHDILFRNGVCRLTLPQAFSYDAGTYTCTATNNLGSQNTSSTLQVSDSQSDLPDCWADYDWASSLETGKHCRNIDEIENSSKIQGMIVQEGMLAPSFPDGTPPIFEKVFSNARFAQGGDALFEGRVTGQPRPVVSWTRKGGPLLDSQKHRLSYEEQTGNVSLCITRIGPGDEGEYTCTARNQFGEATCSVYIQPEGLAMPVQPQGMRKETQMRQQTQQMTQSGMQQMQTTQSMQRTQTMQYTNGFSSVEEDFKVDTFEYRLLREVSFRESLTRRYAGESDMSLSTVVERHLGPPAPPQVQAKPRNSKLNEGSDAVFTAVVPANPKPRLTWFKNGKRLASSQKHQTTYSNQQASLRINQVSAQDSGHYTLLAENPQGCVVTSAYLAVEPSAQQEQVYEREMLSQKSFVETESVEGKMIAPNFARGCTDRDVTEGKMTRFDCRVTGRPYPEVTWFINGRQVIDDATHKVLVNESGNHALMITNVSRHDSGTVTCVAKNKAGETSFECKLNVIEKELVVSPKFVQRFSAVSVKEGEPVSLTARAVGTPVPNITWQKDGVPIISNNDVSIMTSGGGSTLEIFACKPQDAGWYQCMAQNMAGSTATRARVHVQKIVKQDLYQPSRLHLPTPTTVIQPEPAPEPEIIYLRHVERSAPKSPRGEQDKVYPPPQFIIPLSDQSQTEGARVHFEARVEPVGDPSMNVQWYHNGKPLPASSRMTTTFRFGFIALDMLSIVPEDAGEYTCVVTSNTGTVQSVARFTVTSRASIDQKSQYPDSLQYISQLEDYSKYQRTDSFEEISPVRPTFIRPLKDLGQLQEGRNAHFEAQLTPVSDPTMRVDWFKDGRPITASSRITNIFNFGYVSLNILHLRAEDSGVYTVRAVNRWGEAVSQSSVQVISRSSVTGDLGIPEQQRYIDSVEALEAYSQQALKKAMYEPPESTSPPVFQTQVQDQLGIKEGGFAHFEARLEPVGDSTLRVEWLKDGRPVEASSRITSFFNFGYVALTIKHVATHDSGRYTCRAYNQLGEATTSANLGVVSRQDVIMDSQHSSSLQKIQHLEDSSRYMRSQQEEASVTQKPRFLGPLKGTNKIVEGQRAHFEARVEPLSDTTMKIEWYFNGKALQTANRIQTYHDFGYVAVDILSVRAEDAGTYTVVARNALGEAQLSATMQVETRAAVDTRSMHSGVYDKTKQMEEYRHVEPTYNIEEISKSKPVFTVPLSDPPPVNEGKNIHLECRLEPMGDPTMRVEWFQNGKPVTVGSRFRTYYDFGYVALDIVHVTSIDSGEYTVRATNHLGSAHTSACVRVMSRSDIVTETQNESSLEQIQYLEDSKMRKHVQEDVTIVSPPVFTRPLHNIETLEGTNIHLECRLQPVGDPSMRVDWFVNGKPVRVGHRFRPAYDFDYVALDLLSVYPNDSGVYTCQARNQLGEAVTSSSVRVIAKKDLLLESQHPGGLEKIQYLEDSSRYKRTDTVDELVMVKPRFVTKPKSAENLREGGHAHFECKLEPVTDPNLKVEWYKNGRPIIVGHRFRPIHDFGYVALDIIDLIAEDSGVYTCRATNLLGSDETTCSLKCSSSSQVVTSTQNESGLEQIQYLEDRSKYHRSEVVEETTTQAPVFTTSLKQCNIKEGQRAHFECRLIPVSDNTMKVEWFHNNQPVKSGSRFTETNNFGFVALDILHCLPEDSGTYTCRAKNVNGEALTSSTLNVSSRKSIYLESQHESALNKLNQFEEPKYHKPTGPEEAATQAPVFTQPMRDLRTSENQHAHFEARLIPVGDPRLKVEWLRNGVPISASNRVTTMHDFGYVALNMKYVYPEDSGTYTCRATNDLGEAVTSATLVVQSRASLLTETQHEGALQKLQALEDSAKYKRTEVQDIVVTQKPYFSAQLNGPTQLVEGQSAHYECRIEPYPDPNLKVEWFHNGVPLQTGHRFRTTYDFGFAALDILTVYGEDTGEYTCRATNKLGQAVSSVKLNVQPRAGIIRDTQHQDALQKIQYLEDDSRYKKTVEQEPTVTEKPQFGRPLKNIEHLPEGKMAHLEATLTPVNDPTMKVEWFRNGRPIPQGHRFKTTYDFGFVALDVLYAYAEDSGTYMCKARNAAGEAVTTCSVTVDSKAGLQLDTLDEQRLKKIRELEQFERPQQEEVEPVAQKPVFITPLNSLENLKEGDHAHLECRIEPINDPNLKIEWFVNGKAITTGHRFRTTHDFGYVALDILYSYAEDSGTYMCKATNKMGEAVNTCNIKVQSRRNILLDTHHPEGLEKIRELEAQGHPQRLEVEEPVPSPPRFVTELRGTNELAEGQTAHFEAQIEPLHDPNLRVEVYHNGKPLGSASRFHITFDFGYFALDIGHCLASDAGEYTVKAVNKLGSCVSSTTMQVKEKGSIILDSQRPEGLEKIKKLEAGRPEKPEVVEAATRQRPVFTQPLQNIDAIAESQTAHFECRLIPVGDPTLKVEWFRNEKLLEDSSRITKTHDFGYVSMDMTHVREDDEGVYMCRASNALGEAVTTASMKIKTKASIQSETQHPEGMRKIRQLEEGKEPSRKEEPEQAFEKPIFTQVLTGPSELWEGQRAHFEARVVPVGDPTMKFQWFCNGVELKMGSRFHVTHDFGFVTLDIMATVPEDSGVYMCKAVNAAGEAVSSTSLKVKPRSAISGEPIQPDAWQKIQLKEAQMSKVPEGYEDTARQMAPVFTKHLNNADKLVEGSHVYLEAQVEPKEDPNLRVEWFKNGKPLTTGTRIKPTFDFGLVTLSVNGVRPDDSAIYTCKATNLHGEAVSTCTIKVEDRHWLLANSLRPEALPLIDALEGPKTTKSEVAEPVFEGPVFISHLNNVVCQEGENSHFECRVEPAKDPTLNIEFFANGKLLPTGARFKGNHDFGFVTLDINSCYAEDSGIYTVKATNSKGQASTSGSLRCTGKDGIYLQTQHPQGQAGLEKVQEVDDAYANKLQRPPLKAEDAYPKPVWTTPLQPEFKLGEAQPLHLEATVEPKEDPNLKIEWFFKGKALEHGSRFKMTSEFGFVTLDLTEVYERDQGIYTCKAWNKSGEAFTSTTVYCTSKAGLIEKTQHPKGQEGLGKIQELEESLRKEDAKLADSEEGQPPVFTSQFQNVSNLSEGEIAHFEASLTPVGDQTMVVEWFYNGKLLEASHRIRTVHAFGMVVLEILGTKIEDSGVYTCRATNKWGQAEISVTLECVDMSKGQKPQFTTHIKSVEGLKDGDSVHFECTLIPVGDPTMTVEWFHNGRPIRHSTRIKQVSDFGFVLMDIAYTQTHDTGEYVCRAKNKYGEDFTRAHVVCVGKGGVYYDTLQPDSLQKIRELESGAGPTQAAPTPVTEPPRFITQIQDVTALKESQSAHFEARLTPVNDPNLVVEWYFNGKKLPHGHRYRTFHDFGIVILDILYCYAENSGEYECRATNLIGSDSTKAVLKCSSKANLILTSQLPEGMEGGLEKIQNLEESMYKTREQQISETKGQAPVFTVPLSNIDKLREGESAHFEARLTPTDDPKLKVEWFWNNKPLRTGSRFRTFHDFGFVILEISPVYPEDSGEYSCRASNEWGQAVTTSIMKVEGKRSIIMESQLPKGMEGTIDKIAELEGLGQLRPPTLPEDDLGKPPEFITSPSDLTLVEYSLAHFECKLTPVNDPSLRVEWFHNGKPLTAGSRFKTINDFGYVILEISGVDTRDSGLYTCKATNKHGEAVVSCKLQVRGRQGIIMEPQLPTTFSSGTESIQKLEEGLHKKDEVLPDEEQPNPPRFVVELKDTESLEGGKAHFDCKVEPVNDPTLRIDWFFNGRPFATGSRVHMLNDFGFVVLDMEYVYARDSGEYICRATNKWGTATTKAKLVCKAKRDVVLDSQLPFGMSGEKLKELEKGKATEARPSDEGPQVPPKFVTQITSATVGENEPVRFECRVEPKNDPTLRIEWYRNGKLLPSGHRFKTIFDLGFVSLDILYVYPEDSGEYVCRAVNAYGEDFTKATVSCKKVPSIILQNQVPKGMKKSEQLMQMEATIKKYTSEVHLTEEDLYEPEKKQPPRFVTQIQDQTSLVEMEATKFECQLAPVGDPNMKVEWFFNGKPLHHKNRFTPIYDFGYVAMNFGWVYPEDSGEYLCRATNLYGMDETRAIIKTAGKPGIIYESQLPKGMKSIERIREMEASWQLSPEARVEEEKEKQGPVFVSHPEPVTVEEGECARFCCRVTGHPRPRVMWIINDHTVVNGARYKLTYDGMWHLDIPKTRQYDHGKVVVLARNSSGEAKVETTLNVKPRGDDYRGVLKNSPRPWYDTELIPYQQERMETELEKVFEERQAALAEQKGVDFNPELNKQRSKEPEPQWTKSVKNKKGEEYYSKLRELEEGQIVKENRLREASHQFAIPGEKVTHKSVARGMAQSYESNLKKEPELMPWQKGRNLRQTGYLSQDQEQSEEVAQDQRTTVTRAPVDPLESTVHGKEVHTAVQKQTQKEVKDDQEITRKISTTETTEVEHKATTQERVVQGQVKPAKPPVFTKKIQPCRAFENEQARFEVEFDGDPLPKIQWYREDFLIQSSPDLQVHTFSTKSILVLRQVFLEDSGVFSVIAENRGGRAKCSANLVVEERKRAGRGGVVPPSFLTTVQSSAVTAGQLARFDAKIDGSKPVDVYWLKNGKKISPDIRYKTLEEDNTYTLLIIESVPEDSGNYECVAINKGGEARCQAELLVDSPKKGPGKVDTKQGPEVAPTVVEPLTDQAKKEGQPVLFKCKISAKPAPQIQWFKGNQAIKLSKYFQMGKEGDTYTLRISEAFPEDEGTYKCVASNQAGEVSLSANLKVLAPDSNEVAPTLVPMRDVVVAEGSSAQFRTQVTGKPTPNIEWYREGDLIPQSADFQMIHEGKNVVLLIATTYEEDSGVFTCRATNSAGQTETSAKLIVKSKNT
ncbi:titin isoform X2 [Cimex lectularius]|uniref:Ig-like domain-containing protein n=1 Tax=Cimex lectularius TaxID=79782 RepID=A0A8I6SF81_CIMLE|nr:titin isoform X2 [Cimex lectularius]